MTMEPSGTGRLVVSLAVLALLALAVRFTMEAGKFQYFAWLALGFFAFRIVLLHFKARYSKNSDLAPFDGETSNDGAGEALRQPGKATR